MKDYSLRIKTDKEVIDKIKGLSISHKPLPQIEDTFYRPKDLRLEEYNTNNICVRKRHFITDNSYSLDEIIIKKQTNSYTDIKKQLTDNSLHSIEDWLNKNRFIEWGKVNYNSVEYLFKTDNGIVKALVQTLDPIGKFVKFEAESQEIVSLILKDLDIQHSKNISKNSAVLLAESKGLI